ncbi:MAG TPA: NAD(P)H-hydrate dehydratase [Cyclobacteriaceae bacterium]|jgi:NAD(P)H-hydrate epimerase|nr:NAD(P)H-hydrate dehydratase [Cyclobacteriaceae bacterium]
MLKILSLKQTKELDQFTIDKEPIASIDLMERACAAFIDWFVLHFRPDKKIGIVCGPGNNGGDGLGIARMLKELGYPVKVWIVKDNLKESEDFKTNLKRIQGKISPYEISKESDRGLFTGCDVLLDAIFGSGLSRPTDGIFAQVISCINQTDAIRIAVDIPSGLFADSPSSGEIVHADHTVTFQLPKLAFLFPENHQWFGQWHLVDIGLSKEFIKSTPVSNYFVTEKSIKKIVRPRDQFSHKGTYGHALLIAGSYGKMGACVLAAKAALRSGLGLLTTHIPVCGYFIIQTSAPEAMASLDTSDNYFSSAPENLNYSSIGIGPGLGTNSETVIALAKIFKKFKKPVVIDADALNMLSLNQELLQLIPEESILTPHPKEFERIAGSWKNDFEKLGLLRSFSIKLKSIIVLKGAYTSIACPDGNVFFNATGNPGMAKGGSGDVLTGILTALLAQGYSPKDSALLGVYLHGLAGDLAANEFGMNSMTASDIIDWIPGSFKKLIRR